MKKNNCLVQSKFGLNPFFLKKFDLLSHLASDLKILNFGVFQLLLK